MKKIVLICKALSDRNRLRIIAALSSYDELCGCQITELLRVSSATASRHLSTLQNAGLIANRKEGRWIYFRKNTPLERSGELFGIGAWLSEELEKSEEIKDDLIRLQSIVTMDRTELCRIQRGEKCCPQ